MTLTAVDKKLMRRKVVFDVPMMRNWRIATLSLTKADVAI